MATIDVEKTVQATDTYGDVYAGRVDSHKVVDGKILYYNVDIKQKWNKDHWEKPEEKKGVKSFLAGSVEAMPQAPVAGFAT